jgi:integrase
MYFDARAAKQLLPGEHMVIDGCPGLRLVATATTKTFTYRYKAVATGFMKQVAIGQWPATSVQTAAAKWQALRDQRGDGVDPGQAKRAARQALSPLRLDPASTPVRAVVMDYVTGHVEHSRKAAGALAARRALEQLLGEEPEFAARAAAGLTRAEAFDLLDARKAKPTAAIKLRSMLGSAWDFALDAGRLPDNTPNWWRLVMKGRLQSKGKIVGGKHVGRARRHLRPLEVGQLINWLPNMHAIGRDITVMYLWTCARGVEICGLRPEHLAIEGDGELWWTVPKALTKNADVEDAVDLRVPLFGQACEVIERRLKAVGDSGFLFAGRDGGQYLQKTYSTYIYGLQPYSEKVARRESEGLICPVQGWTPHNLRRTGRTLLSSLGCSDEVAEAIIGHMPSEIVGIYNAYSYDAERKLWLGKLSAYLDLLAKPD